MKTAKVVARTEKNVGIWTPEGKSPLYKFKYTFDDGVEVTAQHQSDSPKFNIGDEVEYKITKENQYGKLASVSKPNDFKKGGYNKGITEELLKAVVAGGIAVNQYALGKITEDQIIAATAKFIKLIP